MNGFIQTIKTELLDLKDDGSVWLNQEYFNYSTGLRMVKEKNGRNFLVLPVANKRQKLNNAIQTWHWQYNKLQRK
ncbi:hypothetical protein MASR2M47_37920 [Draconibacterium sp.]